jgi:hypothetical protein
MGIRTPDLLHAMPDDFVWRRPPGSDTGRSGGRQCLAVAGSGWHRLRALRHGPSLTSAADGPGVGAGACGGLRDQLAARNYDEPGKKSGQRSSWRVSSMRMTLVAARLTQQRRQTLEFAACCACLCRPGLNVLAAVDTAAVETIASRVGCISAFFTCSARASISRDLKGGR